MATPRDTLLAEAESLGLTVDPKWNDEDLQAEIDKALAAPSKPSEDKPKKGGKPAKQAALPVEQPEEHGELKAGDELRNNIINRLHIAGEFVEPGKTLTVTAAHLQAPRFVGKLQNALRSKTLVKV